MMFQVDEQSKTPIYCQIADWLQKQIEMGVYREGERLPSERKLCAYTGAARNTIKRAYEELERRGASSFGKNGGMYVKTRDLFDEEKEAEKKIHEAVEKLRNAGLSWHEADHLFLEYIWNHVPAAEKIKMAWVDCSVEFLQDTAREIEKNCNVIVTPLLFDEVVEDPGLLTEREYDVVATTVNHYEVIRQVAVKQTGGTLPFEMDMVVLSISRETVSRIAKIEKDMLVVVAYDEEWYRYSIERYLMEYAAEGEVFYGRLDEVQTRLSACNIERTIVILPQDFSYGEGKVKNLFDYCMDHNIINIISC